jgi:hypothetical protein
MRTSALKTHIFWLKTSKLNPKSKKGAPRITPYFGGLKLQHFAAMDLNPHIVANKSLKINP